MLLIFVDDEGHVLELNEDALTLLQVHAGRGRPWYELFGLDPNSSVGAKIARAQQDTEVTKLAPFIIRGAEGARLVDGVVGPREDGAVMIVRELSDIRRLARAISEWWCRRGRRGSPLTDRVLAVPAAGRDRWW
ncbi:MAG: hypothetical protein U5O39_06135 [Gammaproteobacteria bacterium]|nr:hypothetical protein [Gammaproteobacteria bacterium]